MSKLHNSYKYKPATFKQKNRFEACDVVIRQNTFLQK